MTKFINALTGTVMWVAENRVEEYKAAGHQLAADPLGEPTKATKEKWQNKEVVKETPKKRTSSKK